MTLEQFLDKWCDALNGGDQRHVHNDLERVVAPFRAEIGRLNQEISGHLDRLQEAHKENTLLRRALGELIAYEWGTGDLAVGIGRAQVHVQADGNLTVWGRAAALLEKIRGPEPFEWGTRRGANAGDAGAMNDEAVYEEGWNSGVESCAVEVARLGLMKLADHLRTFKMPDRCAECGGTGWRELRKCSPCKGSGRVQRS